MNACMYVCVYVSMEEGNKITNQTTPFNGVIAHVFLTELLEVLGLSARTKSVHPL